MTGPPPPAVHFLPVLMGVAGYLALHHLWIWLGRRSEPVYLWVAAWSTTSLLYLASHYIQVAYNRPEPAVLGGRLAWTSAIGLIFVMIGLSHALAGVRPSRPFMGTVAAGCAGLLLVLWLTEAFVTGRAYARTDLLGYGSLAPVPGPFMPMLAPLVLLVFVYAWQTLGRGQMDPRERRVIQVAFIVYGLFALNDVLHAARVIQSIRVFDYAFVAVGMGLTYMLVGRYTRLYDHLEEEVVARTTALTDQQRATAALATLTQSLTATLSLEEVLDRIVRAAVELFGSSVSRLWLVEEGGDGLSLRAHAGAITDVTGITRLQVGEGLVGRIVATRSPLVVRDLGDDSRPLNLARLRAEGAVSFAGVPLMLGSQILGALGVATRTPRDFGEEDLSLLQSLATHAAIAIENARLHEEIHQRLRESETLLNVSQALAETADLTETVRRVARETARALGADMVGMYLVDRQEFVLRPIAGYHIPRDLLAVFMQFPFPLKGHRAIEEARDTGQPVWTSDAETDPRVDRESWKRFPHRSSVFVPMGSGEGLLGGIFAVWWEQRREPTPDDLRLALAIGRHATAIIEKARLHEALGRRLDRVQTLTRLNRVLSSSLERDRVLAEIARAAAQLMDVPVASIWLADEVAGRLDLVGFSDPAVEADFPTRSIGFDQGVIGWVATHRRPLNIPDAFADGRFVALDWWRAHGLKSFYGVPVVHEGSLLALLALNGRTPFHLDAEDESLLGAFVAQAAVAIQNASLYEAQGQARRSAELALAQVKQLQGMLPICAYCKKIRDDSNYWQTVEAYIGERSEATFSHGICPECKEKIVKPEMERWRREQGEPS
ncbi:MAG: GAF domain-containing protein [Candidatus Rokubacteria bacterium]|nr:GAF domain-containing protein [Candidatus Rokubacteria bacterium]